MATGKLRNLYEDNEHYNKAFLLYDRLGDRIGSMERFCQSDFRNDILPKLNNVNVAEGKELRTLGIGSGSGELECHVLKQLIQKFPRISNHVVEPSAELAGKYKTFLSANSTDFQGIDYHWYPQLLQDFKEDREKRADETKFHFISAIHSLYYFDDLGKWLDYLYSLLEEGGVLMVILTAEDSSLAKLWGEFPGMGNKAKFGFVEFTSANIKSHFDNRQIAHHDFIGYVHMDMAHVFDPTPSTEAELLVDFVSHTIDFRRDADPELRDRFMKCLRQCLEPKGDELIFYGNYGVTVVQKGK